jgi:hypothetical protein
LANLPVSMERVRAQSVTSRRWTLGIIGKADGKKLKAETGEPDAPVLGRRPPRD